MTDLTTRNALLAVMLVMMVLTASAQTRHDREVLTVEGYSGEATVMRSQGRTYVDVQDLARITNGALHFEKEQIVLTLPSSDTQRSANENAKKRGFSRAFMSAAIGAMAATREWGGMLMITVQNGYPVGNNAAGNTIAALQGRAADSVALAAVAASTESDYRGLDLLRNEFNNVQAWSDRFVQARASLSAANLTNTENALQNDQDAQKVIRCGQFLAQMFASGTFQEDASCH